VWLVFGERCVDQHWRGTKKKSEGESLEEQRSTEEEEEIFGECKGA
jgi:hypothetical protein